MKELKFEELTLKQKLGMVMAGIVRPTGLDKTYGTFEENLEFVLELIRNHSLGAVWLNIKSFDVCPDVVERIRAAADYPIVIIGDAENGLGDHLIGRHNSIGATDSEELAYTFGKVTGITARKLGYNALCCPVVDMVKSWAACGGNSRAMGSDKYKVSKLAVAEARGLHDAGILSVAKHYPSPGAASMDNHMTANEYEIPVEELIDYNLYPYREMIKEGLLDGIMAGHRKILNIDPVNPTTVSKSIKQIIRDLGFDGFFITDALDMMAIRAQFGDTNVKGLCVESGIEFILPWFSAKKAYNDLNECYEKGIITDARLDEAVKTVLAAQHKVMMLEPEFTEITEADVKNFNRINKDSIYLKADDGVEKTISRDGKHLFVVLVKNESDVSDDGKVTVDTFTNDWWKPTRIIKKIKDTFPNSSVRAIYQFPSAAQNMSVLQESVDYEDVVFVTFTEAPAYTGSDHITHRAVALITALKLNGKLSTLVHFGNPYPLQELPHIPRLLVGSISADAVDTGIEVIAGEYPANGVITYDVKLP